MRENKCLGRKRIEMDGNVSSMDKELKVNMFTCTRKMLRKYKREKMKAIIHQDEDKRFGGQLPTWEAEPLP